MGKHSLYTGVLNRNKGPKSNDEAMTSAIRFQLVQKRYEVLSIDYRKSKIVSLQENI